MKKMDSKRMTGLAGMLILLGILIAVNVVLGPVRLRKDMTEEKLYTLSDGTRELLKGLDRDVTLKFYFSKSNDRVPVPLKNFAGRVRDLLREYESRSGGRLAVEEFDPKPDSDEEEWAQRYGLQPQSLDAFNADANLYFGIVAVSGNREAVIPVLSMDAEPQLEYNLTRMVSEVTRDKAAKIGLMSALPLQGLNLNPMAGGGSPAWSFITELEQQYDVEHVSMEVDRIPDDIDTLLVVHPAEISDASLYAIDQFVLRGGHLLAFTDPLCLAAQESASPQMQQYGMQPPAMASDLNKLTSAWAGLTMSTGQLACDENAATLLDAGQRKAQRNPAFLSLREGNVNSDEVATASINDLMLPFAGAFSGTVTNGLTMTELLHTARDGFLASTASARYGQFQIADSTQQLPLAIRLQGQFKTAFPDGKPVDKEKADADPGTATNDTANADDPAKDPPQLMESQKPGIVVLVTDVDMLYDRFCMQTMNVFGRTLAQPFNENLSFALNLIEQLSGSDLLIGLRSRGSYQRPFDRVIALEKDAAFRWQAKEEELNQKLQATQQKLAALQQSKGDGQQLVLSPEQEQEVKKFREEAFQTQQALKEVRKNLRSDIERLSTRLKVINIMAIPLFVALYGIGRGIWIRKTR